MTRSLAPFETAIVTAPAVDVTIDRLTWRGAALFDRFALSFHHKEKCHAD